MPGIARTRWPSRKPRSSSVADGNHASSLAGRGRRALQRSAWPLSKRAWREVSSAPRRPSPATRGAPPPIRGAGVRSLRSRRAGDAPHSHRDRPRRASSSASVDGLLTQVHQGFAHLCIVTVTRRQKDAHRAKAQRFTNQHPPSAPRRARASHTTLQPPLPCSRRRRRSRDDLEATASPASPPKQRSNPCRGARCRKRYQRSVTHRRRVEFFESPPRRAMPICASCFGSPLEDHTSEPAWVGSQLTSVAEHRLGFDVDTRRDVDVDVRIERSRQKNRADGMRFAALGKVERRCHEAGTSTSSVAHPTIR